MTKMKISNKYILLVIVVFVLGLLLFTLWKINHNVDSTNQGHVYENPNVRAQKEGISPREAQIENYKDFPQDFPTASFDGNTFHLLAFPQSLPIHKKQNFPDERYKGRSGLIVFQGEKKIWESKEELAEINQQTSKFKDLTGDGVSEIITEDAGGGNVTQCIISVYKWNGSTFILITPLPPEYVNPCEGTDARKGGIKDVDNDGVYELIGFTWELVSPNADPVGPNSYKEIETIYKFDGSKYTLWKETPTGVVGNP